MERSSLFKSVLSNGRLFSLLLGIWSRGLYFVVWSVGIAALQHTKVIVEKALQNVQFHMTTLSIYSWKVFPNFLPIHILCKETFQFLTIDLNLSKKLWYNTLIHHGLTLQKCNMHYRRTDIIIEKWYIKELHTKVHYNFNK